MSSGFDKLEHELPRKLPFSLIPSADREDYEVHLFSLQKLGYSKATIREFIRLERERRLAPIKKGLSQPSPLLDAKALKEVRRGAALVIRRITSEKRNRGRHIVRRPKKLNLPPDANTHVSRLVDALGRMRALLDDGIETSGIYKLAVERKMAPKRKAGEKLGKLNAHKDENIAQWTVKLIEDLRANPRHSPTQAAKAYVRKLTVKNGQRRPGYRRLLEEVRKTDPSLINTSRRKKK